MTTILTHELLDFEDSSVDEDSYFSSGGEPFEIYYPGDSDESFIDNMSPDDEDALSEASTVPNDDHLEENESETDDEVDVESDDEEQIVQSQKKIKLDEPLDPPVENIADESLNDDQKCPICLDTWSNEGEHRLCSLRCGHLFGLKCITQWFSVAPNAGSRKCPECNTKATKKDIRVLYAKKLVSVDTSEIEKLKDQLKEACSKKEIVEKELIQYQIKEILHKQELNNLKLRIQDLEKTVHQIRTEKNSFTFQNENLILKEKKVFNFCNTGSCRVMAYNPWHKILVASSGNNICRIFMDSLSMSSNNTTHNGSIRDMAFQEKHSNLLLSVAFDKKIMLTDIRTNLLAHSYQEKTCLWSCCWSNYSNQTFFVGGAKGNITEYDIRHLQSGISTKENAEDRSPVVSLASVPTSSTALRAGGYLACQLNSCYAYAFKEGSYIANRIGLEGPFTALRYNEKDNHVLLSCRANSSNPFVRHIVCLIEKNDEQIQFNQVHSFHGGNSQKLLSRPCYMNLQNDTVVVANNESRKSVVAWSVLNGQETYNIPISEPVVDVCSFGSDTIYQAILTSNKLHLYEHTDLKTKECN